MIRRRRIALALAPLGMRELTPNWSWPVRLLFGLLVSAVSAGVILRWVPLEVKDVTLPILPATAGLILFRGFWGKLSGAAVLVAAAFVFRWTLILSLVGIAPLL